MAESSSGRVQFGPFEADLHTHELWKYGTRIKLVGQPFEVLALLLSRPGELVTRDTLRERLWPGDTFVDFNHGLNAAVNKLRDALSDSADNPRYVETLPRRGYRFIATVTRSSTVPAVASPDTPRVSETGSLSEENIEVPPFTQSENAVVPPDQTRRWRVYVIAALFLAAFILFPTLVWFVVNRVTVAGAKDGNSPGQRIRPLTNLSTETSEPAFSPDGNY